MPAIQHFIVHNKHLGTAERESVFIHARPQLPFSYAFVCPECGDLWARCPVLLGDKMQKFFLWNCNCKKCSQSVLHPRGSLLLALEPEFNAAVLEAAAHWEFERAMDFASSYY